jgi:hypothetical protein
MGDTMGNWGKTGMGSHKHYVSGHSGPSSRYKQEKMREANKELERLANLKPKTQWFDSIAGLFRRRKGR